MIHVLQLPIHINDEQMDLNGTIHPLIKAEDFILLQMLFIHYLTELFRRFINESSNA